MLDSAPICHSCNKPLRDGNPRWSSAGRKEIWHYHCATRAGLTQESRGWSFGRTATGFDIKMRAARAEIVCAIGFRSGVSLRKNLALPPLPLPLKGEPS